MQHKGEVDTMGTPYNGFHENTTQGTYHIKESDTVIEEKYSNKQPQKTTSDTKETLSLLFGIISIVLCTSGIWGIILGIIAIVLGNAVIKENGETKNARIGKICGTIGLIIGIIMIVLIAILGILWFGAVSSIS